MKKIKIKTKNKILHVIGSNDLTVHDEFVLKNPPNLKPKNKRAK